MAFPVILVNSGAVGASDSAASGAGPSTALTGTAGATDGAGTTVTLDAGTDLTNVATDGSHVIFINDTTAGHRNFAKITSKAGSGGATPTVGVSEAFTGSLSGKTWAIGGKRQTISSATSYRLWDNNASSGDAMPGWTVEMESGHSETVTGDGSARIVFRRSGDTTNGPITLRGTAGAGTLPILTFTADGAAFLGSVSAADLITLQNFEIKNSNASKTASVAMQSTGWYWLIDGVHVRTSGSKFWKAIIADGAMSIRNCEIGYCANIGIGIGTATLPSIRNCWIHNCTSHGISAATIDALGTVIFGNLITANGGDGININNSSTTRIRRWLIAHNTLDSNTGDGIEIANSTASLAALEVVNNICSNNGAYGINFSGATDAVMAANGPLVVSNQTYNNTSGAYHSNTAGYNYNNCPWASGDNNLDPQFTNTGGNDYSIGTNLKAKGYPLGGTTPIGRSSTYSYVDPGAAQRQEPLMPVGQTKIIQNIGTY